MNRMVFRSPFRLCLAAFLCAGLLVSCSSYQSFRKAELAAASGDWDEAVLQYMKAAEEEPENLSYRTALLRAKIKASQEHFEKGKRYRDAGVPERAMVEFQQAVQLDPTNQYAQVELEETSNQLLKAQQGDEALTIDDMKKKTRGARAQPPVLSPRSNEPINLEFPEPTSVKDIYRALGQAFGINILFDPNLKDQEITIVLKDVVAQDALEVLMRAAGHFYKVQDEHTIIVVADTPQNRRNYEDLVIQTFFLSNADIKQVMTMLRSLVDAKKIATNEQLNAIVLRDTADKVKVAERIIEANDKSKAEVVVDVELLQVNTNKMQNLGVLLSSYSIQQSYTDGTADGGGSLRLSDFDDITNNNWVFSIPNFLYNFAKSSSEAQILAKPQLRISEGEKSTLLIGERVPIPTTTFNTSNTVGGNIVPLTTFQYTDVGIQIDIEPRVHHNKEVTLKVKVEVSNISNFVEAAGGQRQPVIGTRRIESTIRLKDGETNFLAGLIRTEDLDTDTGVPGLSDIPLIGRLFSNTNRDHTRTDVILTMTPHIIRTPNLTEEDLLPIWVGTESNITFRGGSPRVESEIEGPFEQPDNRERVQQMLRERLQRLPRGLRENAGESPEDLEGVEPPEPEGVDLAPSSAPRGLFQEEPEEEPQEDDGSGFIEENRSSFEGVPSFFEPAMPGMLDTRGTGLVRPAGWRGAGTIRPAAQAEASTNAPVELRLVPEQLRVMPGQTFQVLVEVDARQAISHLPMKLHFDPAVLEVVEVKAGTFLGSKEESAILADSSQPGRISLGASRLGERPAISGKGTLAVILFKAVGEGSTAITFDEAGAKDATLTAVSPVAAAPAQVVVDEDFVLPERPELPKHPILQVS